MNGRDRTVRRMLTLDEVRTTSSPAVFRAFGDHLLFQNGLVYSVARESDLDQPDLVPSLPDAYVITNGVGIEYGWQHLEGCRCDLCRDTSQEAA